MAPQFRMTYPYARFFPDRGEVIEPDQIIEADENPDGNFFEVVSAPTTKKAPAEPEASTETPQEA